MGPHLLGGTPIQNVTFRPCIANNPHPGPPQGEGALFCSDLTVAFGRGMGPGSRGSKVTSLAGDTISFSFPDPQAYLRMAEVISRGRSGSLP